MKRLTLTALSITLFWIIGLGIVLLPPGFDEVSRKPPPPLPVPAIGSGTTDAISGATSRQLAVPTDCNNECATFPKSSDQHTYCLSVCGLSPTDWEEPERPQPPLDSALEQMLRQKDEAIRTHNLTLCQTIPDDRLRTACEVRVTEDLLE